MYIMNEPKNGIEFDIFINDHESIEIKWHLIDRHL